MAGIMGRKNILPTGAAGFLGFLLAIRLLEDSEGWV